MSDVRATDAAPGVAHLPNPGASLSLRFDCCSVDLPTRVLDVRGIRVSVTAPIHVCGRPEIGVRYTAIWECKTGVARSVGTVESQRRVPPTWVLHFEGPVERLVIDKRYPDDSPGTLDIGSACIPARVIDRSLNGVACLVPALVKLQRGQRVRVIVGRHKRAGTIARVRPLGNQIRVGIQLDEL